MCGRFALSVPPEVLAEQYDLPLESASASVAAPRYNIAPTQSVAAVRIAPQDDGEQAAVGEAGRKKGPGRELVALHWGLLPFWAKDRSMAARMINARSETVAEKPAFRSAFQHRRCIIPASGFFEWQKRPDDKQPYFIHPADGAPLLHLAGLWERWTPKQGDGRSVESCAILTRAANETMAPLHDRMPVTLRPEDHAAWLDPGERDKQKLNAIITQPPATQLAFYPVSREVNSPRKDEASLLEAIEA